MNGGVRIAVGDRIVPPDSDIVLKIDYSAENGSAARVFQLAADIIHSFEDIDLFLVSSVSSSIETKLVLEDLQKSSIKIFLRNILRETEDAALKDLDWKKQVGKYLVRAKYAAIEWLDQEIAKDESAKIEDLTEHIRELAAQTDVRHLPDYPKLNSARVAQSLDKFQRIKSRFRDDEELTITLGQDEYHVHLDRDWLPSEHLGEADTAQELSNEIDMVLVIRKPDLLGKSQWQFRHGKRNFSAPIEDARWLDDFHAGIHPLKPGDALRVRIRFDYRYDEHGDLVESCETVVKVYGVLHQDRDHTKPLF